MSWRLIVQLLDALTEVRLRDANTSPLEERTQFTFLRQHRLGLNQDVRSLFGKEVIDDLVVLVSIPGPVHDHAVGRSPGLKLNQVLCEVRQRVFFDFRRQRPEFFPLRNLPGRGIPPHSHRPEQLIEPLLVDGVGQKRLGILCLVDWPTHRDTPFSTSAR